MSAMLRRLIVGVSPNQVHRSRRPACRQSCAVCSEWRCAMRRGRPVCEQRISLEAVLVLRDDDDIRIHRLRVERHDNLIFAGLELAVRSLHSTIQGGTVIAASDRFRNEA
jgi:hypothetical protein